jgi:hypothetical protein
MNTVFLNLKYSFKNLLLDGGVVLAKKSEDLLGNKKFKVELKVETITSIRMAFISSLWDKFSVPVISDAGGHGDEGAIFSIMREAVHDKPEIEEESFELPTGINAQTEVERQMEKLSVTKSKLTVLRISCLGLLAGMWITLAECGAIAVAGL